MEKWFRFFGILGIVVFLFGLVGALLISGSNQPLPVLLVAHMILGGLLLLVWLFSSAGKLSGAGTVLRGRGVRFGINAAAYSAVFVGFLVLTNWYVSRHDLRKDVTKEGAFSLASQSEQVLQGLEQPLRIVALVGMDPGDEERMKELLELYRHANPVKVTVESLNPRNKPHLVDKYGFKPGNLVYIGYGEDGKAGVNRLNDSSEEAITNAILKISRGAAKKIYYLQGHREPALDDESAAGLKLFSQALGDENLTVESLLLGQKPAVPADAAAVLVVSPKSPLLDAERESLIKYAESGGRLLLFSDPRSGGDVPELAAHFGIEIGDNVVIDQVQRLFAAPVLGAEPMVQSYGAHAITRGMTPNQYTVYNLASSVRAAPQKRSDGVYTELIKTSPASWAETDLDRLFAEEPSAALDRDRDITGPVSLGLAFEQKLKDEKTGEEKADAKAPEFEKSIRIVVFGDSDWISNYYLGRHPYNRDLVLNGLNWLLGEEGGIAIRPRKVGESGANIPESTLETMLATSFLLPELFLIFGLYVWWRRRTVGA